MIINKRATLAAAGGVALSLALAATPLHAQGTADDVQTDPTVPGADGTALTAEEVEMAAENAGEEIGEGAMAVKEGAEEMGEEIEAGTEQAESTVMEALDDGELAAKLQQDIATDPRFGEYTIEVTDIDGRYTVSGMIDDFEDYTALEEMLANVEGIDPAMIDNEVVQN